MKCCPKCGGTDGFYTKGTYWKYYDCDGNEKDHELIDEGKMATCLDCGRQIKLTAVLAKNERKDDSNG